MTASIANAGSSLEPSSLQVSVLSVAQAPPGVPSQAVISAPGDVDAAAVKAALSNSDDVLGVVQNRIVAITQSAGKLHGSAWSSTFLQPSSAVHMAWVQVLEVSVIKDPWHALFASSHNFNDRG